jgi:hypothetical protein
VQHDIEGAGRGHDGDHEGFVRKLGQVVVFAMKGHDPATETPGVIHTVQQSFTGAIWGDDQDCVATSDRRQSVHGDGEVGSRRYRGCPSDPGGHQLGTAGGLRLLGQMGHEVPRLTFRGTDHQERVTAL